MHLGQRYHVIVEARPHRRDDLSTIPDSDATYWIRTIPATDCHNFMLGNIPDERQGIISYRNNSQIIPRTGRGNFSIVCRDELYEQLVPYHPWQVYLVGGQNGNKDFLDRVPFEVGIDNPLPPNGRPLEDDLFYRWSMGRKPMFLNFSDPTINNLHKNASQFRDEKVVIPKDYPEGHWIYMVITGNVTKGEEQDISRRFVPSAHPVSHSPTFPTPFFPIFRNFSTKLCFRTEPNN